MTALLKDALAPNLVQTLENSPPLFTWAICEHRPRLQFRDRHPNGALLTDYVVTEAGFGADFGCREVLQHQMPQIRPAPRCGRYRGHGAGAEMHGGVDRSALAAEDVAAVERGLENLGRHIRNTGQYGVPLVVAINRFDSTRRLNWMSSKPT